MGGCRPCEGRAESRKRGVYSLVSSANTSGLTEATASLLSGGQGGSERGPRIAVAAAGKGGGRTEDTLRRPSDSCDASRQERGVKVSVAGGPNTSVCLRRTVSKAGLGSEASRGAEVSSRRSAATGVLGTCRCVLATAKVGEVGTSGIGATTFEVTVSCSRQGVLEAEKVCEGHMAFSAAPISATTDGDACRTGKEGAYRDRTHDTTSVAVRRDSHAYVY